MKKTTFKRNGIEYIECKTYVEAGTGEEINGTHEWIKENYTIREIIKKNSYGYNNKITWKTYLITQKATQQKLAI